MKKQNNETLTIEIPEGFMIDTFDKASNQIKLKAKPKNIMERIRNIEDVLHENRWTLESFDDACQDLQPDEKAYRIIKLLVETLNEGWKPDWNNSNQNKYYPWFEMNGSSGFRYDGCDVWGTNSDVGSRLCFKSRELAEYAGKQFSDTYKQFMVIEYLWNTQM